MKYFPLIVRFIKMCICVLIFTNLVNVSLAITTAQTSSRIHKENSREQEALSYLLKTLKNLKIYSRRYPQFPLCTMFITEGTTNSYIEIRLREQHEGPGCKGDPNVSPTLDIYRVINTNPLKVYWLDSSNDKFIPISESLKSIK